SARQRMGVVSGRLRPWLLRTRTDGRSGLPGARGRIGGRAPPRDPGRMHALLCRDVPHPVSLPRSARVPCRGPGLSTRPVGRACAYIPPNQRRSTVVTLVLPAYLIALLPEPDRRATGSHRSVSLRPGPWQTVVGELSERFPLLARRVLPDCINLANGFVLV